MIRAMPKGPAAQYGGFTVVEMLAVLTILALLVALALPVLSRAERTAWKATCMGNERQIGAAAGLYTRDYDDVLPFWNTAYITEPPTAEQPQKTWKYAVQPYVRSGNPASYTDGRGPHAETGVWYCPSSAAFLDGLGLVNGSMATRGSTASYGMSMFIAFDRYGPAPQPPATRYRPGLPIALLVHPTSTIFVADGGLYGRIDNPINMRWQRYTELYHDSSVQNWERRDAHGDGADYLFCDWHVKWIQDTAAYPANGAAAAQAARRYFAATAVDDAALALER